MSRRHAILLALSLIVAGCRASSPAPRRPAEPPPPTPPVVTTSSTPLTLGTSTAPRPPTPTLSTATPAGPRTVPVPYRIEVRAAGVEDFPAIVESVLADRRGWSRAGFALERRPDAPFRVIIAEGPEVDALCLPYETYGLYSCQLGPVVAINADRWRRATPQWTGDLPTYREMLVNHEVGHLLGQRHRPCPQPGRPAPVMAQQSTDLDGCRPNSWPLDEEIELAARHQRPLAPPYERD